MSRAAAIMAILKPRIQVYVHLSQRFYNDDAKYIHSNVYSYLSANPSRLLERFYPELRLPDHCSEDKLFRFAEE